VLVYSFLFSLLQNTPFFPLLTTQKLSKMFLFAFLYHFNSYVFFPFFLAFILFLSCFVLSCYILLLHFIVPFCFILLSYFVVSFTCFILVCLYLFHFVMPFFFCLVSFIFALSFSLIRSLLQTSQHAFSLHDFSF
jgi:hypothetical protein